MKLNDLVTSYEQVREPVERTYKSVTGGELPSCINVAIMDFERYQMWSKILMHRTSNLLKDNGEYAGKLEFVKSRFPRWALRSNPLSCKLLAKILLKSKRFSDNNIIVIENSVRKAIPVIFHGIGHVDYSLNQRNGYSEEMGEIAAFLYMDEMSYAVPRIYPELVGLEDFFNEWVPHTLGKFHKKCADYARSFRPKHQLRDLNEKMGFLLSFSSPAQLQNELAKLV